MRRLFPFILIVLMGCEDSAIFHSVGGSHYPPSQTNAIQISFSDRHSLIDCGATLIGIINNADLNVIQHTVAINGGTHFVKVGNDIEVWHLNGGVCLNGQTR